MANPTHRLLALLEMLQTQGLVSGSELARQLEIDTRTLRRYIAQLEEMGIPVTAERGRDGGYRLMHGFKLPPMMFTNEEALAVSLGLLAARSLGLAEAAPAVSSAQAKLERVLPSTLKRRLRAVAETVTLDLSQAPPAHDNDALLTLSAAAQSQQRVHLHYRAENAETERDFDPYGLAYRAGRWYAVGHCHLRAGLRSFRLDRIVSVHAIPASFLRPTGFDILGYLTQSVAVMPRSHTVEVLLQTTLDQARHEIYAELGVLEATTDGVRLRSQVTTLDWMARQLAQLPFPFAVISPPELLAELHALAHKLGAAQLRVL
ncbi:YafY family protein [Silvimonas sp.]|uniref:helix-turn-helix transcriptional regulator n=1 Tax=Silvimonas sp. TaxID=2650811 RepID=UPI002843AFCD|nr:YafY family protein [Silvimonas sp.]MDR3427085.1 YafY family protein [Silvimonas sp.]